MSDTRAFGSSTYALMCVGYEGNCPRSPARAYSGHVWACTTYTLAPKGVGHGGDLPLVPWTKHGGTRAYHFGICCPGASGCEWDLSPPPQEQD
jgi:hypothetical protein